MDDPIVEGVNEVRGFSVRRKDRTTGEPVGQRLTFTEEAFIIEPYSAHGHRAEEKE